MSYTVEYYTGTKIGGLLLDIFPFSCFADATFYLINNG